MKNQAVQIGERLKFLRKLQKKTLEEFYGPITPYFNNFSSIENGNRKMGKRLTNEIIAHYHINPIWLEKGEEPIFNPVASHEDKNGVPYFDIDLSAEPFHEDMIAQEEPAFYIDFKPFNDCSAYLTIYGDSMFPKYASGDIISVKKLANTGVILWGEAYLVLTDVTANNLCTVKIVLPHKNPEKVILRASNPNYPGDTVIEKKAIIALYSIKGKITRNLL